MTHEGGLGMKVQDIKDIAKKKGVNSGKANKPDLIRAIQKAEGNNSIILPSGKCATTVRQA